MPTKRARGTTAPTTPKGQLARPATRATPATKTGHGGEPHQIAEAPAQVLTTNQGVPIADDQNSLQAVKRGPVLLEDFVLREKVTHFDHERIPERIVHARGSAAHGYFQAYRSLGKLTRAAFLQDPQAPAPATPPGMSAASR